MFDINEANPGAVTFDGISVLGGIGVSIRLDGEERELRHAASERRSGTDNGEDCAEYIHVYRDREERPEAVVRLTLRCKSGVLLVSVDGRVVSDNDFANSLAFAPDNGITLKLAMPTGIEGAMANYQHKDWWTRPHFGKDFAALPGRTLSLLWLKGGLYGHLLPVCGPRYRADLEGGAGQDALYVRLSSHQGGMTACDTLAFALSAGNDPYALAERNAEVALHELGYPALPRSRKKYPEILDYLGWCSWDAFYHQVDEAGLLAKAEEMRRDGLPVKWVMIDDGWSAVTDRKLAGFDADPAKFPGGLARAIRSLKERYGIERVGVWHTIAGYWNGIHPDSGLADEYAEALFTTRRGNVIPAPDAGRGFGFWNAWHGYLKRQGVDFVKVDSQSAVNNFLRHHLPVGTSASAAHMALEASVALHFDHTVINCMGMSSENIWHRPVSAVSRNSDDFVPQERHGFREHALQNAYNSFFHGPFYWGDWDMFWTNNRDDVQNAVLRAISGGPVYFSDALGKTDPDKLWPLIYGDGRIIRCDRTANPTPDCLISSPAETGKPLKLWNRAGASGIVAAFHIGEGERALTGSVSAADVPGLATGPVLLYDFFAKTARRLEAGESARFELQAEECKLFSLIPIVGDVVPIGLTNKYISAHAVRECRTSEGIAAVKLVEGGRFAFASRCRPRNVRANGQPAEWRECDGGFYEADCSGIAGEAVIEIEG